MRTPSRKFKVGDITQDPLPKPDLVVCRDCLFHLSYSDILVFLRNHIQSCALSDDVYPHDTGGFLNKDIKSGDFRQLDLFSALFSSSTKCFYALKTPSSRP
jgi:hypothetical protein